MRRDLIKSRLRIDDSSEDAQIDACIADQADAFEAEIDPDLLANPAFLEALNAAANDWVAGEYAAQCFRAEGNHETIWIEGIEIKPFIRDVSDPMGLKAQAKNRLLSVARRNLTSYSQAGVAPVVTE